MLWFNFILGLNFVFFCFVKSLQIYAPPRAFSWKIVLKYKVRQSKNGKFTSKYKASLIDFETQISLGR